MLPKTTVSSLFYKRISRLNDDAVLWFRIYYQAKKEATINGKGSQLNSLACSCCLDLHMSSCPRVQQFLGDYNNRFLDFFGKISQQFAPIVWNLFSRLTFMLRLVCDSRSNISAQIKAYGLRV